MRAVTVVQVAAGIIVSAAGALVLAAEVFFPAEGWRGVEARTSNEMQLAMGAIAVAGVLNVLAALGARGGRMPFDLFAIVCALAGFVTALPISSIVGLATESAWASVGLLFGIAISFLVVVVLRVIAILQALAHRHRLP